MTSKKSTKTKAKKVSKKKGLLPEVEELENYSIAITAKFSIVEIKMKSDWRWKVKMLVHETLPKTYRDFNVKLEFDPEPFAKTIAQYEKEARDLDQNPTLLPDMDKRSLKQIDEKIAHTKKEMEKLRAECTDIEFVAQTEEIKYPNGDTAMLFKVLDTVIQPLNEKKYRLNDYRAVLDPILK